MRFTSVCLIFPSAFCSHCCRAPGFGALNAFSFIQSHLHFDVRVLLLPVSVALEFNSSSGFDLFTSLCERFSSRCLLFNIFSFLCSQLPLGFFLPTPFCVRFSVFRSFISCFSLVIVSHLGTCDDSHD